MEITILQSGFVTGDFLNPVAYSGEMNSRILEITHPLFDNAFYQLLILKENRPYILGIQDGKATLPPSLTDIACTLQCQFMALRKNSGIDISNGDCSCYPTSSNDNSQMIFKSDKFNMTVAEGLNINGLTPIPPYEQLVDMYNNLSKAKLSVENAKIENENILNTIEEKINQLQQSTYLLNLDKEKNSRIQYDMDLNDKITMLISTVNELNNKLLEKTLYRISYYNDEGIVLETQYKRHGESITISSLIPTKENAIFVNWKDTKTNKEYNSNELYLLDYDLELYPIWE